MCFHPRKIRRADGVIMEVRCDHCLQCLKQYQDSWTARLNEEIKMWSPVQQGKALVEPVVFFTFDYNPEKIPCSYLVVSSTGVYLTRKKPDCRILEYWSDINRETGPEWLVRRRKILAEYQKAVRWVWSTLERQATSVDRLFGNYKEFIRTRGFNKYGEPLLDFYGCDFDCDLPDFSEKFHHFGNSALEYPVYDFEVFTSIEGIGDPILAIEFHEVSKPDVQNCFKRARRKLEYDGVFTAPVNPRINPFWRGSDGVDHELPSCALTKTFKYFVTSEYGPNTFRPHYHGVCYGLTYDEFEKYIVPEWKDYGRVDFSVLESSGGALSYIAKYCSKGTYEHPLCARDFYYPDGKEYHSKRCELALAAFGVDWPLVRPTFHLVSKGIGACYAFREEILSYFGSKLLEYLTPSGSLRYYSTGVDLSGRKPYVNLSELGVHDDSWFPCKSLKVELSDDGSLILRKYTGKNYDRLVGEDIITPDAVASEVFEQSLLNKQYTRTYVAQSPKQNPVSPVCISCWHKIGAKKLFNPVTKTTAISLPRYYRQWLISPLTSLLRQSASTRLHPPVHALESFLMEHEGDQDPLTCSVRSYLANKDIRDSLTSERLRVSAQRFYCKTISPRLM